jgi:hypothetical protein
MAARQYADGFCPVKDADGVLQSDDRCNSPAARLVSSFRPRNFFVGFAASQHCVNNQHLALQASGNGLMNES